MTTEPVRASAAWLRLRESADSAARATVLVQDLRRLLPDAGSIVVHDLGCGSGSMVRWLAPQLTGPQRWVLYDRDDELLALAAATPPPRAADGAPVTIETRRRDITRLGEKELAGAGLVTASALLDMLTADQLDRLVASCAAARCPVLIALSVTGRVALTPPHGSDARIADAFNAHQRRMTPAGPLLGPDAADAAAVAFARHGLEVRVEPSPWRLGPEHGDLVAAWLTGWVGAAREQQPELGDIATEHLRRRLAEAGAGSLSVTVQHADLLAWPRPVVGGPPLRRSSHPGPASNRSDSA